MQNLGKLALSVGLVLAIVCAFVDLPWLPWVVGLLGLIVGYLNVGEGETKTFLLAAVGLLLALWCIGKQDGNPDLLNAIIVCVKRFVAHALLVVAFLTVYRTARN